MHPLLANRRRLALYLLAWLPVGVFLGALFVETRYLFWWQAAALVVPATALYAFICLAAWYPCRAMPLEAGQGLRLILAHTTTAALAGGLWLVLGHLWSELLAYSEQFKAAERAWYASGLLVFMLGMLLYLFSVFVHYHAAGVEAAAEREKQLVELDLLAQQAELKHLRAQIQPHFLFNSLNSISALTTEDPAGARDMCLRLAAFFRAGIAAGKETAIPLTRELALIEDYLAIEQVRFGERLRVQREIEPETLACAVPPLILQPLVENAVSHGIAQLVDGGMVRLEARREDGMLHLLVENPVDPTARARRGEGIGLVNVRQRLGALFQEDGRVYVDKTDARFRVTLVLPCRVTSA